MENGWEGLPSIVFFKTADKNKNFKTIIKAGGDFINEKYMLPLYIFLKYLSTYFLCK